MGRFGYFRSIGLPILRDIAIRTSDDSSGVPAASLGMIFENSG